jgi:hypothetical protein
MEVFTDSKPPTRPGWTKPFFWSATITIAVAFLMAMLFSSCSVYRSNGRSTFETRYGNQDAVTTQAFSQAAVAGGGPTDASSQTSALTDEDTCWTQPAQDPLWDLPENQSLHVRALNHQLIEVCLVR